jgi:hypothetical protein
VRVAVVGLGPIGVEVARAVLARPGLTLVAAADVAPALAGRPLAEVVPDGGAIDLVVDGSMDAVLARGVEAVALCTGSRLESVGADLERCVAAGVHVVSTCEELSWPWEAAQARALDDAARAAGCTLVGTGVNPGFVMDRLPLQLAGVCVRVDGVRVERVVDAGQRRPPLRRKVGEGLTVEEFRAGVAAGRLGHVGLAASARLLARGLRSALAQFDETVDPVLDSDGRVLGVRQRLSAATADGRPIELRLQMSVGAPQPHDRVVIDGDPPLDVTIAGGTHGDRATVGAVVDALGRMARAPRGLITVADLY